MMRPRHLSIFVLSGAFAAAGGDARAVAGAEDWPQWRGPLRDGISTETGLLKEWPEGGPAVVWKASGLGGGYSAPALHDGRIFGSGYVGEDEVVWALDAKDGSAVWKTKVAKAFREIDYSEGPRATPVVEGGRVTTLGAAGNLICLNEADGALIWSKDLVADFGGKMMSEWGFSESPLVDGDRLLCSPGGPKGTVAALDKKTGATLWQCEELTDPAAYSSLVVGEIGGVRQCIVLTGESVAGIAVDDGRLLWRAERRGKTAVVPTPILRGNQVWVTSGYGVGCSLFEVAEDAGSFSASLVYSNRKIKNGQGGAIRVGEQIYALSGVQMVCMDWATGEVLWKERSLGKGALVFADGHFILRGEQGRVALIEASAEAYVEKSRFEQADRSEEKSWAHPVVSEGRLYLSDQDTLICYDLRG